MGSSSKKNPRQQAMPDPRQLIELQAATNRVNVDTPFGSQTYGAGPNGSTTLRTDIGPQGQALVGRGMSLGMTDSARQNVDPRMNELAGALLGRAGNRFGLNLGGSLQLSPDAVTPQPQAKPQAQTPPAPQGLAPAPQGGGQGFGGGGGGFWTNPQVRNDRLREMVGVKP
jgi:hypothetical protein